MQLSDDYIAGLFDGEGWFYIMRTSGKFNRHKRKYAFQCKAGLTIREEFIIDYLVNNFGGSKFVNKPRKLAHSLTYNWNVTGANALAFAKRMENKLQLKNKQAKLLINFQNIKDSRNPKNSPLSDEEYDTYQLLYEEMRLQNKKGINK